MSSRVYVVSWTNGNEVLLDGVYSTADYARDRANALSLSDSLDTTATPPSGRWVVHSYVIDESNYFPLVPLTTLPKPR